MTIGYEFESIPESGNMEAEAFFESVAEAARTGQRYKPLALAAMAAARAALAEGLGRGAATESEFEFELENEAEWETSPAAFELAYRNGEAGPAAALMEHLGHQAAEAESNGESFAFLAPLLPLALKALPLAGKALGMGAKFLPKIASTVMKAAPKIMKGVKGAAKALRNNPATKQLVQNIPQVVRRTTVDIARQIANGKPVTAQSAVRALAKNTAQVLGDPKTAVRTYHRSRKIDRKFHRAAVQAANGGGTTAHPCVCN